VPVGQPPGYYRRHSVCVAPPVGLSHLCVIWKKKCGAPPSRPPDTDTLGLYRARLPACVCVCVRASVRVQ
ncbi:Exocyst complex component 3-like protein, partial [Frankliniella fusca]